jgi:hypothetical protein
VKLEKDIEQSAVKRLYEQIGCMQLKTSDPLRHFPDRMVLLPEGRVVFVEFKRPKEKLRIAQRVIKSQLEKLGFEVYVVDNQTDYIELLTQL